MNRILLILLFPFLMTGKGGSQADSLPSKPALNVVHGNVGIIQMNLNYERTLFYLNHSHLNLRFGYGIWTGNGGGNNIFLSWQYILGKRRSHLEFGMGIHYMIDDCCGEPWFLGLDNIYNSDLYPLINVGYRFEPPDAGPVLRIGVGSESIINLGLGYKF